MALPTAEEVTNWYLYGQSTIPSDLLDDPRIRPTGKTSSVPIDINEYMSGPGRFATPGQIAYVDWFMNPLAQNDGGELLYPASYALKPGTYTKEDLWREFGITAPVSIGLRIAKIDQALYDDGKDDFLGRAYLWNTTAFKIKDGAKFVVEANGNRYIDDFALVPYSDTSNPENFDFSSGSGFGGLANTFLQPRVDPSNIGRRVNFEFTGNRPTQRLTYTDYVQANSNAISPNPLLYGRIAANGLAFTDRLFNSGSTRFLDNAGRAIIYGTNGPDSLSAALFVGNLLIDTRLRNAATANGVSLIGGLGDDILTGAVASRDYLQGGTGYDTYYTDDGDTVLDSDGAGRVFLGQDQLTGGTWNSKEEAYISRDGRYRYELGGGRLLVNGTLEITGYRNGDLEIALEKKEDDSPDKDGWGHMFDSSQYHGTPIVLDLDGNGVRTTSVAGDSYFDHDGNGFAEATGWVDAGDGLLAWDRNGNGRIDDGSELFGDHVRLADGSFAANGFVALAALDENHDGRMDAADAAWSQLRVWQDTDGDGYTDAGDCKRWRIAA